MGCQWGLVGLGLFTEHPTVMCHCPMRFLFSSVDNVVTAFEKLLEEEDATGGVLLVNPQSTNYFFPTRRIKRDAKL